MNKATLVNELTNVLSTRQEAQQALDRIFSSMKKALRSGEKVVISEFGSFHPKIRQARKARNIRKNEEISVPSKRVVKFTSARNLLAD